MDPVSQFKFACPVCRQHLQARAEEAGQTTECPCCFKRLIVPQAPAEGGGKLIITASLADTRRVPVSNSLEAGPRPVRPVPAKGPITYILMALVAVVIAVGGVLVVKRLLTGDGGPVQPQLWTDNVDELQLLDPPAVGRLNRWDFQLTSAVWQDTRLILKQDGGDPEALRMAITFPLKGGELVPGKTFRLGLDDPPFDKAPEMIWKDEQGRDEHKPVVSGYILRVEFDEVSKTIVSGRIHICLLDEPRSWVAGSFCAVNRTRIK